MVFKWNDETSARFLDRYKNYPCLWDTKLPAYKDRDIRAITIGYLLQDLNIPGVTPLDVKLKIKSIRTCYTAELKKIQRSRNSGCSEEEVYVPKAEWFHQADSFLRGVCFPRDTPNHKRKKKPNNTQLLDDCISISSVESIDSYSSLSSIDDNKRFRRYPSNRSSHSQDLWIEDQPLANLKKSPSEEMNNFESVDIQETSSWSNSLMYTSSQANNSGSERLHGMVEDRLATLAQQDDECDIVGKNVAAKLRSLLPIQKIYAEKIINDTLYEAQLNNLSRHSRLANPN